MKSTCSELILQIIELILNTHSALQLSKIFGLSKQKNHIPDFSLGVQMNDDLKMNNRGLINLIIEADNNINLTRITANLLER